MDFKWELYKVCIQQEPTAFPKELPVNLVVLFLVSLLPFKPLWQINYLLGRKEVPSVFSYVDTLKNSRQILWPGGWHFETTSLSEYVTFSI